MAKRVECGGQRPDGRHCGSFLGEMADGKLRIFCRTCKGYHDVYVTDLIAELEGMIRRGQQVNQFLASLEDVANINEVDKTA